nr:MAG TPA: hypothetical protein [Caudoviricetes sp.]
MIQKQQPSVRNFTAKTGNCLCSPLQPASAGHAASISITTMGPR